MSKRERRVANLEGGLLEGAPRPERLAGWRALLGGSGHLVDDGPQMMIAAQPIRHSRPVRATNRVGYRTRNGEPPLLVNREARSLGEDGHEAVGVLGLDPGLSVYTEEHRQFGIGDALEQPRLPAEPGSGHRHAADRVPDVVMAIAEGSLAILPRLAPVD